MTDRETILGSLPDGSEIDVPASFLRNRSDSVDLWGEFESRLQAVGGQLLPGAALKFLIESRDGPFWADADAQRFLPRSAVRAGNVWEAEVGICLGEFAISETGTVVVSAGEGRMRLTSLAPPVNVVLIREDHIVATPEEAFAQMPGSTSVLITGTSRTADIEGVMVRGVHGPRELYVVRI